MITVLGLGAGDLSQLPLGIYRRLLAAEHLFLRTKEHPVIKELEAEGLSYQSFDEIYEKHDQFEAVYGEIVAILKDEAKTKDIIYAVPGHPMVAEKTTQLLLEDKDLQVQIEGGQSFIDPLFASLKIDPIEGFQFLDALSFEKDELQLSQHIIICQVYDQYIASNVKLTLMEQLPDEYEVYIVTAAGSKEEKITKVPLYELDREARVNNLTSVYVPPVKEDEMLYHDFRSFRRIIAALRGPGGCPWDQKQTHESLKKYLLEEAYEVLDAIDSEDDAHLAEELGDVLLQVLLHAQIGEDEGMFTIDDVIRGISEKMIRRHPHVFGEVSADTAEEVVTNWEQIKRMEKGNDLEEKSILDEVTKGLPGLMKAVQYQKKAAKVGFDWDDVEPMWDKVFEEIQEYKEAVTEKQKGEAVQEFGDILFALANIARFYKFDPEEALAITNQKFARRFRFIEEELKTQGLKFEEQTLEQLDAIWEKAKQKGL
ncbi:nucleoside triphosphate pyrophosphohydrolase [Bacillus timonensis]|uniref:Nucleoside triphosphate pyrophosphohydrolase n=1 Tax=Bacillus timonensis TaxID=1033734 RepID=A0A4S3PPE4_9BACI|nr:nucleoside triphosphate pyrophosphohydrolase [Bacillus timonensis]THE11470.1 nucleoside triphosphate pyrophosphohydrolase [Bacillus timonensis]